MSEEIDPKREPQNSSKDSRETRRSKKLATGLAFGIGSAAIVAALLYSKRSKPTEPDA